MTYQCKIYTAPGPDGGDSTVVESGGVITIKSGGTLVVEAVGGLTVNGENVGTATIADVTATAAEINKLAGSGAVVASGTQSVHIADLATDANGTAIAGKVNAIIALLEAFGMAASS